MVLERLTIPWIVAPVLIYAVYAIYIKVTSKSGLPDLPWIDASKSYFSVFKLRRYEETRRLYKDIYENYSIKGLSCIYPSLLNDPQIVVPPSFIPWIVSQPDHILSAREHHREGLQSDYTMLDPIIVLNPIHEHVIREDLTKALKSVTEPVMDELRNSCEEYWDFDDWQEVGVWDSMLKIFARTSNRIFVGLPLCRNDDFLQNCIAYSQDIPLSSFALRLLPSMLKELLWWPMTTNNRRHFNNAAKYLKPVIEQRLADFKARVAFPDDKAEQANDFISWSIKTASNATDPKESTSDMIAKRYMVINFAAIHTTTLTTTNVLFDIVAASPEQRVLEQLHEEITRVLREEGGKWTKNSLAKMHRTDSVIRESMRLHNFVNWGVQRKVTAPGGVTMSNGLHLPNGSTVSVQAYAIHRESSHYANPDVFDAFRFSRPREGNTTYASDDNDGDQAKAGSEKTVEANGTTPIRGTASVATGETFLQFGHGRFSCPGRFFAVQEIKLLLAHMILNYDIKPLAVRPPNTWIGDMTLPPTKAKTSIRRRRRQMVPK